MNKKGDLFDVIVWMIIVFAGFIFFAGFIYGFNSLTNILISVPTPPGAIVNVSGIASDTFQMVNSALPALRWIALVLAIGMVLAIFLSNFLVKAHPAFFVVYILMTVIAVVLSTYISNSYESILTPSNPLTSTLQSFTAMDYIMLHLPILERRFHL